MPRIRFANSHLDDVAHVLSQTHQHAAQYLEQAPVLALLACRKFGSHITYGELEQFGDRVAAGPRLKDLLAVYGGQRAMAKLVSGALKPSDIAVLDALNRLDASSLSQSIPNDSQRVWLDGIAKWLNLARRNRRQCEKFNVAWIARQLGADLSRFEQVDSLIDFLSRGNGQLNDRWSWDAAMRAVENWHRELRDEYALAQLVANRNDREAFDLVICKAAIPDCVSVDGFDFLALRTLRHLRMEGVAMHHCVAAYAPAVKAGKCSIVSVRKDNVGVATLEISRNGVISQLKGHCNAAPSTQIRAACELYVLQHWKPAERVAA